MLHRNERPIHSCGVTKSRDLTGLGVSSHYIVMKKNVNSNFTKLLCQHLAMKAELYASF